MKKVFLISAICTWATLVCACNSDSTAPACTPGCNGDIATNCDNDPNAPDGPPIARTETCDPGMCKYQGSTQSAKCLTKCPTEKASDYSCDANNNSVFTACLQNEAGAWYQTSHNVQTCHHGCADGNCIKLAPEEGLTCETESDGFKCAGNIKLSCVDNVVVAEQCPDAEVCVNRAGQILCKPSCDEKSSFVQCIDDDHSLIKTCAHDSNQVLYYSEVTITCPDGCDIKTNKCVKNLDRDGTICNPEKVSNTCVDDILSICDKSSGYYTSRDCAKYEQHCVTFQTGDTSEALCAESCDNPGATRSVCDGDDSVLQTCTADDNGTKIWRITSTNPCENGCHTVTGECKGPSNCKETDASSCSGDTMNGCLYDEESQTWQKGSVNCLDNDGICYSGITTGYCLPVVTPDVPPETQPSELGAECIPNTFVEYCDGNTLVYCYRNSNEVPFTVYRLNCSDENETCGITHYQDPVRGLINQGQCLNNINLCDDPLNPVSIRCYKNAAYSIKCQPHTDKKLHTVAQESREVCKHSCVDGVGCVDDEE
ncbi:MAG: hypothetical protein IKY83_01115 [Proteobacteria bacterium]|nr:hypothetical protein [Pseudomonadota bacterium]